MEPDLIGRHWGKARSGGEGPAWHPLVFHALDVAASMDALIDGDPHRLQSLVALGAGESKAVRAGLILAAALHDLGKYAPAFQAKARHVSPGAVRDIVDWDDEGHDRAGRCLWGVYGRRLINGPDDAVARLTRWVEAACCHHGRGRPNGEEIQASLWVEEKVRPTAADIEAMEAYINAVFHLPETQGWQGLTSPPDDATDEAWVAGLVTQADWLGSNMQYFPYEEPTHTVE